MKRVLVTGASGFVGARTIAPLQARGFEVHAVGRGRPATAGTAVWHVSDLLTDDIGGLLDEVRPTHLLHLAWVTAHGAYWTAPENLDWVAASVRLVRAFHAAGGRRVVVAGTCAEYDWGSDCCGAGTPLEPATLYGASKDALRRLLAAYGRTLDLEVAWARLFFAFGPGEQAGRLVASVARSLARNEPVACTEGLQVRDFLYVDDVAGALVAVLDSAVTGPVDVGSGEGVELRHVVLRLESLANCAGLVRLGAVPTRDEPRRIVADAARLRAEAGWRPAFSLDDGLSETLAWWRAREEAAPSPDAGGGYPVA